MSPSKRERERARQLHHKRIARQERAKQRRQRTIALVAIGALVLSAITAAIVGVILSGGDDPDPPTDDTAADDTAANDTTGDDTALDPEAGQDTEAPPEQDPLPSTDPPQYEGPPDPAQAEERTWRATLSTTVGTVELELDGEAAPQAVANFVHLARDGYYDGTACHRLLPDSLLQCGDPSATGTGGPGYGFGPIENAPADDLYPAGTLAMARVGQDGESMGSQFFLVFDDVTLPSDSAGGYSVFGTVTEGMDTLAQVGAAGLGSEGERPAMDVIIENVEIQ